MPNRPSRTSVCSRRFAERNSLTLHPGFGAAPDVPPQQLTDGQWLADKSTGVGGIAVDALVFEFMGLALLALCVIVLAVPSSRRSSARHIRDY